jgi:membrane protease YdiL (CAAX protease family)
LSWTIVLLLTMAAIHFHVFGVTTLQDAATDIHYALGTMAALYLLTFAASLLIFPFFWDKGFFVGLQWNFATALRLRRRLFGAAGACFVLALIDELALPGSPNAPIDKLFQTSSQAWLLFAFGVTIAPFFEEMIFRGFLLPSLCTAFDWIDERRTHQPPPPLGQDGQPQWSFPAMAVASILTSIPFALMHAEQTGYSLGPFVLLVSVSLVLCWARLSTRSLAASILVHASYNFLLFFLMLLGTSGFQHLDKM